MFSLVVVVDEHPHDGLTIRTAMEGKKIAISRAIFSEPPGLAPTMAERVRFAKDLLGLVIENLKPKYRNSVAGWSGKSNSKTWVEIERST